MTIALHVFCLAVGALILPYKVAEVFRGRRDLVSIAFCGYYGFSALSYLVLLPPVYVAVDHFSSVPNTGGVISALCVMVLTAAQQVVLMHWAYPPRQAARRSRRRVAFIALTMLLFVVFFLARVPQQRRFSDFYVEYARDLVHAPYLAVYIAACAAGQADVVRHCWKYAKVANRSWLRRGMLTTTAGAGMILVYCAIRIGDLVAGQVDIDLRALEPAAWLCGDIGSALALVGWVLPTFGLRLSAAYRWFHNYRAYHALFPLWQLLCQLAPEIALDPETSRRRDRFRVRNLDFWLYRRIIEIEDGQRALRPYLCPPAGQGDPDAPPCPVTAGGYAQTLLAAHADAMLREKNTPPGTAGAGHRPPGGTATPPANPPGAEPGPAADRLGPMALDELPDFADQVRWLSDVARALRRAPGHRAPDRRAC